MRVHGTGAKDVYVSNPGDVITLDLYAFVTGADGDPNNDGFSTGIGSIVSSFGGLLGDIVALPPVSPFNGLSSGVGLTGDRDGDGDLDHGGLNPMDVNEYYRAYHYGGPVLSPPAGGFFIGQANFVAIALSDWTTAVNWVPRPLNIGNLVQYDGVLQYPPLNTVSVAAPVTIHATDITPAGSATFIGGTVNDHLNVDGHVRVTPGQTLILNNGVTINHGALLNTRDDSGNYGSHELRVSDLASGNNGGSMFINTMKLGVAAPGQFTHSAGLSRFNSSVVVGAAAGNAGTLLVTGGSLIAGGELTLGSAARGSYVQSGGFVTVGTLSMTGASGNDASFDITGGQFTATRGATIGAGSGAARMTVSGDAQASVNGTLLLNASGANRGQLDVTGGRLSAGRMHVIAGSTLAQSGGTVVPNLLSIGRPQADASAVAEYHFDGGTLNFGSAFVGDNGHGKLVQTAGRVVSGGILHLYDTYELHDGDAKTWGLVLNAPANGLAGLLDQSGGTLETDFLDVHGTYRVTGGTFQVNKELRVFDGGTIDFGNGGAAIHAASNTMLTLPPSGLTNTGGAALVGEHGSLVNYQPGQDPHAVFGTVQTQGLLHEQGTPLNVTADQLVGGQGVIVGNTTVAGRLRPGVGAGTLEIVGTLTQLPTASLDIEIGGVGADDSDLLTISGDVSLAGLLNVSLINGYVPTDEDAFTFLTTGGTLTGRFSNTAGDQLYFDGGRFDVSYSGNAVTLSNFAAVPEPTGAMLMLAGVVASATTRRRRYRR